MPLFGKAYLLKALHHMGHQKAHEDTIVQEFKNMMRVATTTAHFEEPKTEGLAWIFHSDLRTTALVLQTLLEVQGGFTHDEKVVQWLITRRKSMRWRTTQENLYALLALAEYFKTYEKDEPNFKTEIRLAGKKLLQESFAGYSLRTARVVSPLKDFKQGKELPLEVKKDGSGQLYYGVRMAYYPLQPVATRDEGISILKTVTPFNDSLWTGSNFDAGALVKVELRIITPQGRNYVVVDDPLPAGFEAVNLSLKTASAEIGQDLMERSITSHRVWWGGFNHVEMRDDRVLLFADYLTAGAHTHTYLVRATTFGSFSMPATHAECMYEPEIFGRNAGKQIDVE